MAENESRSVVINFPTDRRVRVASITFYGAAILTRDEHPLTPSVWFDFAKPITVEEAQAHVQKISAAGGVLGEHGFFIPYPGCAAVHFEFTQIPIPKEERET